MLHMRCLGPILLVVALTAAGCDEKLDDMTGPTPNLEPTFSSIQREIFNSGDPNGRRACIECHNAQLADTNGGLNLTESAAYGRLVGVPSRDKPGAVRVVAGDPENSYLIHKLEGRPDIVGDRMPQIPPYLTPGQIEVIRRWIERGAPND